MLPIIHDSKRYVLAWSRRCRSGVTTPVTPGRSSGHRLAAADDAEVDLANQSGALRFGRL